jgi:isopropylmalate/homocitrate/citramalate synthase
MTARKVTIVEVGPRDGLQNEASIVPTHTKIELIERLAASGLPVVEVTSFVNPRAVPQLADGSIVATETARTEGVRYPALVPNERGYEDALAAGIREIAVFTAASETFNQRNINATIAASIERFAPVVQRAKTDGISVRGYVSMAFGCPYEGDIAPEQVHEVAGRLLDLGIDELSLGDTIGIAVPTQIEPVVAPLFDSWSPERLGLHLHDTRGTALANAWTGFELGITTFDSSVAGLGGCPFADGATGNVATEDLVWMFERCGVATGVDFEQLVATARWISDELGQQPHGHLARLR